MPNRSCNHTEGCSRHFESSLLVVTGRPKRQNDIQLRRLSSVTKSAYTVSLPCEEAL